MKNCEEYPPAVHRRAERTVPWQPSQPASRASAKGAPVLSLHTTVAVPMVSAALRWRTYAAQQARARAAGVGCGGRAGGAAGAAGATQLQLKEPARLQRLQPTRLWSASMRRTLKASASVTASGRPSGTATTCRVESRGAGAGELGASFMQRRPCGAPPHNWRPSLQAGRRRAAAYSPKHKRGAALCQGQGVPHPAHPTRQCARPNHACFPAPQHSKKNTHQDGDPRDEEAQVVLQEGPVPGGAAHPKRLVAARKGRGRGGGWRVEA